MYRGAPTALLLQQGTPSPTVLPHFLQQLFPVLQPILQKLPDGLFGNGSASRGGVGTHDGFHPLLQFGLCTFGYSRAGRAGAGFPIDPIPRVVEPGDRTAQRGPPVAHRFEAVAFFNRELPFK